MLLDLLLPKVDGSKCSNVCVRCPATSRHRDLRINTSWTAATAMRLGAVDYITKPFDDVQC